MSWTELEFRLQHDCPFNDFGRKYPDISFAMWCNGSTDFLQIECNQETYRRIRQDLMVLAKGRGSRILSTSPEPGNLQVIVRTCTCSKGKQVSISSFLQKHDLLELQPTIHFDGWEHYRAIAFKDADVKKFFKGIEPHARSEVLSRRRLDAYTLRDAYLIPLKTLFDRLTWRQASALLGALENEYYQVPKRATTEEIARRFKVPRTTYEEHLRKAEAKVLQSLAPYFSLYARSRTSRALAQPAGRSLTGIAPLQRR